LLGTGLILNWLSRHKHRSELGIHFAGIGLGIAGCAAAVSAFTPWLDWRQQWFAFAALGCLLLIPALGWLPKPVASALNTSGQPMPETPPSALYLRVFMAAYFCAGIGYVVSSTFIVAIVNKLPGLEGQGNLALLAIGLGAVPGCIAWDFIDLRTGPDQDHDELAADFQGRLESQVAIHSKRYLPKSTDPRQAIVRAALQAAGKAGPVGSGTTSDWAFLGDIPTVKVGPGDTFRSHRPNEHITLAEIEAGAAFYTQLATTFFSLQVPHE